MVKNFKCMNLREDLNIHITDKIEASTAPHVLNILAEYRASEEWDKITTVNVLLNTPGGDAASSLLLARNLIELGKEKRVRTIAVGGVSSGGFILFLAGQERIATPYSVFMSHAPRMLDEEENHTPLNRRIPAERALEDAFFKYYTDVLDMPRSQIIKKLHLFEDRIFSPYELYKLNIIDRITDIIL